MAQITDIPSETRDPERASFVGNTTTMAIVAGVLLALVMAAGEQVGERVDAVLLGGIFPIFGIAIHMICNMTAVVTYGLVSALIVANLTPIIAVATATGPMAPLWFATNTGASIGGRVVHYYMVRKDIRDMSLLDTFWVCLGGMIVNSAIMFPVQLLYFAMPLPLISVMKVVEMVSGTVLPTWVVWRAGRALKCARAP